MRTVHSQTFASLLVAGLALTSVITPAVAQEREARRSAEAESGARRSAEGEGQRRSAEGESGARRSAEAEGGARRSAEGEAGARRSEEGERGARDGGEGEGPARGADPLQGFKPQTKREAALFQMILQLRRELAALRREVESQKAPSRTAFDARTDAPQQSNAAKFVLPERWQRTKEGRVFAAYDKNSDEIGSLDEWLEMTNGNVSPARRDVQTQRFNEAEPSGDGKFTPAEFIYWYNIGRHKAVEAQRRARDGDGNRTGPRDGEAGQRRGPRDGEGEQRGPRDSGGTSSERRDGDRE